MGIMPSSMTPSRDQVAATGRRPGCGISDAGSRAVAEDARRVGQEDELLGLQVSGDGGGGGVGVDVQPAARPSSTASDGITGTTPARAEVLDQAGVDARHLADAAQVDRLAVVAGQRQPLAEEALAASSECRPTARPPSWRICRTMPALISSSSTRTTISSVASSV